MTTTTLILMNVPLMVLFMALWVGIPTWLVLRHPDERPKTAAAMSAVRTLTQVSASHDEDASYRRVA